MAEPWAALSSLASRSEVLASSPPPALLRPRVLILDISGSSLESWRLTAGEMLRARDSLACWDVTPEPSHDHALHVGPWHRGPGPCCAVT